MVLLATLAQTFLLGDRRAAEITQEGRDVRGGGECGMPGGRDWAAWDLGVSLPGREASGWRGRWTRQRRDVERARESCSVQRCLLEKLWARQQRTWLSLRGGEIGKTIAFFLCLVVKNRRVYKSVSEKGEWKGESERRGRRTEGVSRRKGGSGTCYCSPAAADY
ncbi:uncharacterized protein LY79DRAFT_86816 [Colletotrichum navitas]|uniref:Uncharacterized protein n=1 Tax=Colletotrichum navitas TaxID=681940 RepID=A0AAD8PLM2_9PEZI|nr:uncharacterized protein LY79DRAFT_86816 [Colletotrichum navitas]KAK1569408.1 hypothetical protein LY79DRAFT_86816 [Colletotrichum navitas]